jgi:hypothetical protein
MAESNKGRKVGRNAAWCKAYRGRGQRERNKALKLLRHFKRHGFVDAGAVACYNALPVLAKPTGSRAILMSAPTKHKCIPPASPMPPVISRRAA